MLKFFFCILSHHSISQLPSEMKRRLTNESNGHHVIEENTNHLAASTTTTKNINGSHMSSEMNGNSNGHIIKKSRRDI